MTDEWISWQHSQCCCGQTCRSEAELVSEIKPWSRFLECRVYVGPNHVLFLWPWENRTYWDWHEVARMHQFAGLWHWCDNGSLPLVRDHAGCNWLINQLCLDNNVINVRGWCYSSIFSYPASFHNVIVAVTMNRWSEVIRIRDQDYCLSKTHSMSSLSQELSNQQLALKSIKHFAI